VKLLLFDIDGTLILTGGAGIRALNRAFFEVTGIANAMDGVRPHGKTDPGIVREVFSACATSGSYSDSMPQILELYVRLLSEEVQNSTTYRVLPGILNLLEHLHGRTDLALGLATGNIESGARIKLARGNLNRYFPFGGFGSDSEIRAELVRQAAEKGARMVGLTIKPDEVFVIGDTPRDIDAGREAGFRTVGVATSDYSTEDLHAAGADLVLTDFERERDQFLRMARIE
jgi:phosphoglycolate phosphatase